MKLVKKVIDASPVEADSAKVRSADIRAGVIVISVPTLVVPSPKGQGAWVTFQTFVSEILGGSVSTP